MTTVETLFETRWIRLQRIGHWDFVRRPHADSCVGILAITPENEVLLVQQFRIPVGRDVIEMPAGIVGDEPEFAGESLAETAGRELLEETGYRAGEIRELIASPTSAGLTSETIHLFLATGLVRETEGGGTGNEQITVHRVPVADLDDWMRARQAEGLAVDLKIHAALRLAGL